MKICINGAEYTLTNEELRQAADEYTCLLISENIRDRIDGGFYEEKLDPCKITDQMIFAIAKDVREYIVDCADLMGPVADNEAIDEIMNGFIEDHPEIAPDDVPEKEVP